MDTMTLERLQQVQERIDAARQGRDVTLIAVSKFVEPERMQIAYDAGVRDFGENYPQHLSEKWEKFPDANWHMIGQMQINKVKYLIGRVKLIQSVDRLALAKEIEKRAASREIVQPVLVQVNIGLEPQKGGAVPDELEAFLASMAEFSHIRVRGLMAIPPAGEDPVPYFSQMRELYEKFRCADSRMPLDILSMGMSHDYEQAIAQGATMVRVGSAIFGPRQIKTQEAVINGQ